jgi:hypothetical protein
MSNRRDSSLPGPVLFAPFLLPARVLLVLPGLDNSARAALSASSMADRSST